jgi:hypothetical protein
MRLLTIDEAERLQGGRLDRRRRYAATDDGTPCAVSGAFVFEVARWSQACTGCHEGAYLLEGRGHGCSECGHTGRRQHAHWAPVSKQPKARNERGPAA